MITLKERLKQGPLTVYECDQCGHLLSYHEKIQGVVYCQIKGCNCKFDYYPPTVAAG